MMNLFLNQNAKLLVAKCKALSFLRPGNIGDAECGDDDAEKL